jgi:hypothetical protein
MNIATIPYSCSVQELNMEVSATCLTRHCNVGQLHIDNYSVRVWSTTPCRHDATVRRTVIWVCANNPAAILQTSAPSRDVIREQSRDIWGEKEGKGRENICGKNCGGVRGGVRGGSGDRTEGKWHLLQPPHPNSGPTGWFNIIYPVKYQ